MVVHPTDGKNVVDIVIRLLYCLFPIQLSSLFGFDLHFPLVLVRYDVTTGGMAQGEKSQTLRHRVPGKSTHAD
jgi:hypothetical protein